MGIDDGSIKAPYSPDGSSPDSQRSESSCQPSLSPKYTSCLQPTPSRCTATRPLPPCRGYTRFEHRQMLSQYCGSASCHTLLPGPVEPWLQARWKERASEQEWTLRVEERYELRYCRRRLPGSCSASVFLPVVALSNSMSAHLGHSLLRSSMRSGSQRACRVCLARRFSTAPSSAICGSRTIVSAGPSRIPVASSPISPLAISRRSATTFASLPTIKPSAQPPLLPSAPDGASAAPKIRVIPPSLDAIKEEGYMDEDVQLLPEDQARMVITPEAIAVSRSSSDHRWPGTLKSQSNCRRSPLGNHQMCLRRDCWHCGWASTVEGVMGTSTPWQSPRSAA